MQCMLTRVTKQRRIAQTCLVSPPRRSEPLRLRGEAQAFSSIGGRHTSRSNATTSSTAVADHTTTGDHTITIDLFGRRINVRSTRSPHQKRNCQRFVVDIGARTESVDAVAVIRPYSKPIAWIRCYAVPSDTRTGHQPIETRIAHHRRRLSDGIGAIQVQQ